MGNAIKKYIKHENYQGEDRRQYVKNDFPPLTGDIRSWWPIWSSLAGLLIIIGVWLTTVKTTAVLATNTACDVRIIDTRVTKLETELPIMKSDVKITKDNVEKLLQSMSAVKAKLGIYDGKD